jgi:spermidine synthase
MQALRHPNVRRVVVVDIDEMVVEVSRRHFPKLAACYDSPRVTLLHEDAADWASAAVQRGDVFDAVLVDSTDFGTSDPLHTSDFYATLRQLARGGKGAVVINLTSLSWNLGGAQEIAHMHAALYTHVAVYQVFQPTYASLVLPTTPQHTLAAGTCCALLPPVGLAVCGAL